MPISWKIHQANRPTGLSDDPRANVSSAGPCTEDLSERLLASVEVACDPRDEDRATDIVPLGMPAKLVGASPALSQVNMETCIPCEHLRTLEQHVLPHDIGLFFKGVCQADRDRLWLRERSLGIASTTSSSDGRSKELYITSALVSTSASFATRMGSILVPQCQLDLHVAN